MAFRFDEVTGENLWRWLVSTLFFTVVIGIPIAALTSVEMSPDVQSVIGVVATIIAAVAVWSDEVPWIGD